MNQDIRNSIAQDWITFILLGCLLLIALLKFRYPKKFEDFLYIISSDKFLSGSIHNNRLSHPFNTGLVFLQWIVMSLFIYFGHCIYTDRTIGKEWITFLYILGGYILFEQIKLGIERFIGYLIEYSSLVKSYTYRKLVFKNFISFLVFIFCILLAYRFDILKNVYLIFFTMVLLTYLSTYLIIYRKMRSEIFKHPSYFILYFCTLEIAPYYILYKVIM